MVGIFPTNFKENEVAELIGIYSAYHKAIKLAWWERGLEFRKGLPTRQRAKLERDMPDVDHLTWVSSAELTEREQVLKKQDEKEVKQFRWLSVGCCLSAGLYCVVRGQITWAMFWFLLAFLFFSWKTVGIIILIGLGIAFPILGLIVLVFLMLSVEIPLWEERVARKEYVAEQQHKELVAAIRKR